MKVGGDAATESLGGHKRREEGLDGAESEVKKKSKYVDGEALEVEETDVNAGLPG